MEISFFSRGTSVSYNEWASLLFLSMMAILFCLDSSRICSGNSDVSHVSKAMWAFSALSLSDQYICHAVAFGGLLLAAVRRTPTVLFCTIPLGQRQSLLALIVFIGGFFSSHRHGHSRVSSVKHYGNEQSSDAGIFRFNKMKGFPAMILNLKRLIILGCVFLGYFFAVSIGEFYTLVISGLNHSRP